MIYNMKKRSLNLHNLKLNGNTSSREKNNSFHNHVSNNELYCNKKKRLKCNEFDCVEEKKYNNEIFSKLKDFYKNNQNFNWEYDSIKDSRRNKRKEGEYINEIMIKEKKKVYANKICNFSKSDVSDGNIEITANKFLIKKRKSMMHEMLYSKSENNSKVKYKIRRKNSQYAKDDSSKKSNFNKKRLMDFITVRKELNHLKKEIKKKEKDNHIEDLLKKDNNKFEKNKNCKRSVESEEINFITDKENEKLAKEENKKHKEYRKYEKLKEKIKPNKCESISINNNLNCNERFFDKYEEKNIKKNGKNLILEITDSKEEMDNKIKSNKNINNGYINHNEVTIYKYNNNKIENKEISGESTSFNCCSNVDKLCEELEEKVINNKIDNSIHYSLKEKIINFSEDAFNNSNLNILSLGNALTLNNKEVFLLKDDNNNINNNNISNINNNKINNINDINNVNNINNNDNNDNSNSNYIKNIDGNNNINNKILEKKKKIKIIHNEILNLMNEDDINRNEVTNGEKNSLENRNVREERKKEIDQNFISKGNKSIFCNPLPVNDENNEKSNNGITYLNNIYVNNLDNKTDDANEKKYYNSISNFYDCEDFSSNKLFLSMKKDGNSKKSIMNNKKKERNMLENKEEYIKNKINSTNYFVKNIKLIYEREKKVLEVSVKFIEKYSYFKTILNTYSENYLIKMNDHITFNLSKILFSNEIIDKINKNNFKNIMKALDFYGYLYNNTFLKNLCNKITVNKWLCNRKFFHKIFRKRILKIGIFFDLIYHFLYLNNIFVDFFFTKKGGKFMKMFLFYDKNKALQLINKIVNDLKYISPSTISVVNFLCGFFSEETQKKKMKKVKKIKNSIKDPYKKKEDIYLKKNIMNIKKNNNSSNGNFHELNQKVKRNCNCLKKKKNGSYIYIKNSKYKKKVLRNILNRIWLKTDLYVKEEVYYGPNFTMKKKKKKNKINNLKKLNNFLYDIHNSSDSSAYSLFTDEERQYNYYKSDENNPNLNEHLNETLHQRIYQEEIEDDIIIQQGNDHENNQHDDYENNEEENIEIETNNENHYENSIKTFHTLDCIPNISFDLYSEDNNYRQKGNSFLSLCFKEEEKCCIDKYIKDLSYLGIRISSKENKVNYFNCFDVNLKIKIKNHLLSNINYNISKDDEHISAFLPVWPNIPDYFGFKITKNIKKEFNEIKKNIMQEKGEKKKKSWDIIINKMNNRIMKFDESINYFDKENKGKHNFDFNKSIISNNSINQHKITNIDEVKIKDCNFFLNIKIYPIRTLVLYILYNSLYKYNDMNFVEFFSNSINNEIKEWLILFLLPNFINKCIHKVTYPLKLTKNIFTESNEFYEDFFSNEYLKINDIEKIIIYTKNNNEEEIEICPFYFCYIWLKSSKYKIDLWISSKINEILFTFPYANFLLSKYFSNFLLFIQLFQSCLDIDHMYLCKSHFYVSLKHNISFLHESMVNVLFSAYRKLKDF